MSSQARVQVPKPYESDVMARKLGLSDALCRNRCLQHILLGTDVDDSAEAIHELLRSVAAQLNAGEVECGQCVVHTQLMKRREGTRTRGRKRTSRCTGARASVCERVEERAKVFAGR